MVHIDRAYVETEIINSPVAPLITWGVLRYALPVLTAVQVVALIALKVGGGRKRSGKVKKMR